MRISKDDIKDFEIPIDFNMKYINYNMRFNVHKVIFTYSTSRDNKRENHKYLIAESNIDAKFKFINYINEFNAEKPYRAISNVKILDVVNLGTVTK